jgi:hypothetical protein
MRQASVVPLVTGSPHWSPRPAGAAILNSAVRVPTPCATFGRSPPSYSRPPVVLGVEFPGGREADGCPLVGDLLAQSRADLVARYRSAERRAPRRGDGFGREPVAVPPAMAVAENPTSRPNWARSSGVAGVRGRATTTANAVATKAIKIDLSRGTYGAVPGSSRLKRSVRSPSPSSSRAQNVSDFRESGPRRWLVPFVESTCALVPRSRPDRGACHRPRRRFGRCCGGGAPAICQPSAAGPGRDVLATPGDTFWVDRLRESKRARRPPVCRAGASARPTRADRAAREAGRPWSVGVMNGALGTRRRWMAGIAVDAG